MLRTQCTCLSLKNNIYYIIGHNTSEGDRMKFIANNYTQQEIIRIIREWSELSQKDFGKTIHRSESSIQSFELGRRSYTVQTLIQIANAHGIKITTEKEEK